MKGKLRLISTSITIIAICLTLIGVITVAAQAHVPTKQIPDPEIHLAEFIQDENRAGGTISGTVTCLGFISDDTTSEVIVGLHDDISSGPVTSEHVLCNQAYEFSDVPDDTYYISAFLDENNSGGGPPDPGEPEAWYGAPDPIVISPTESSYSNIDLELARYIERVSLFDDEGDLVERDWVSQDPAISGDGRYVVFQSRDESYNNRGVHIFDRELDESTTFGALDFGSFFYSPDISADGNFIAAAYRYDPIEGDSVERLVIKEWAVEPENVTVIEPLNENSPYFDAPSISGDGCRVAFEFKYEDTDDIRDVYLYDCDTEDPPALISVAANGTDPGNGQSYDPAISDDGLFVAFKSRATDLIDPPPVITGNLIYVRDIEGGTTELIPLPDGVSGGDFNDAPSISADGRYVAFEYNFEVYVHDRETDETKMISYINGEPSGDSEDPSISGDGRFVTYLTYRYVESDYFADIFVNDLETGTLKMATKGFDGMPNLDSGYYPVISEDGRFVAFQADASDLVVDDTNETRDVFVYMNAPTLTVDIIGNGSVNKDPNQSTYAFDEAVTLTPVPDGGFAFDGWTGADAADLVDNGDGTWSIAMDVDKSITANFIEYVPPVISLSRADYGSLESGPSVTVVVTISGDRQHNVTIDYETSDGTATAGEDYAATSGTLTLLPTDLTQAFNVDILEDTLYEGIEHFNVTISNPVGATLGEPSSAVVSITDNDPEPVEDFMLYLPIVLK